MWHFPQGKGKSHITAVDGQPAVSTWTTGGKAHPAQSHSVLPVIRRTSSFAAQATEGLASSPSYLCLGQLAPVWNEDGQLAPGHREGRKDNHTASSVERVRGHERSGSIRGGKAADSRVEAGGPALRGVARERQPSLTPDAPEPWRGRGPREEAREQRPVPGARLVPQDTGFPSVSPWPSAAAGPGGRAEHEEVPISWRLRRRHHDRSPQPRLAAVAAGR